jgi:hypothetical protein
LRRKVVHIPTVTVIFVLTGGVVYLLVRNTSPV